MDDFDMDLEEELQRELQAGDEEKHDTQADASAELPQNAEMQLDQPGTELAAVPAAVPEVSMAEDIEHRKRERQRKNQEVLKLLTEEQLDRYEAFRRSSLSKPNMRRLLHSITGQAPNPNTTIVMCGITKIFVGDLIETARMIAADAGDKGPLRPVHVHKAYQQLDREGKVPHRVKKIPRLRL